MPITPDIEKKANELLQLISEQAPNLYGRLMALHAQQNTARLKAQRPSLDPAAWVVESLVASAIGPDVATVVALAQAKAEVDVKEAVEEGEEALRASL